VENPPYSTVLHTHELKKCTLHWTGLLRYTATAYKAIRLAVCEVMQLPLNLLRRIGNFKTGTSNSTSRMRRP